MTKAKLETKLGYGDVFTIKQFLRMQKGGSVIFEDGFGSYYDENGNRIIKPINWNEPFLPPIEAKFVHWCNR